MSCYATLQGEIVYQNESLFQAIVAKLREEGFLDARGYFLDECGHRICESSEIAPNVVNNTITIPLACYRNLSRFDFFPGDGKGWLIGTSTDGCFCGWVIEDGIEESFDLQAWAAGNLSDGDETPPPDDDFENLCIWQQTVEMGFHSDMSG